MTKGKGWHRGQPGSRILQGARQALAYAKGQPGQEAYRIHNACGVKDHEREGSREPGYPRKAGGEDAS